MRKLGGIIRRALTHDCMTNGRYLRMLAPFPVWASENLFRELFKLDPIHPSFFGEPVPKVAPWRQKPACKTESVFSKK